MNEKSKDIVELFEEAKLDNEWLERLKTTRSKDSMRKLLEEKGLNLKEILKVKLSTGNTENKKELLDDDELDKVAGGFDWDEFREFIYRCKIQL